MKKNAFFLLLVLGAIVMMMQAASAATQRPRTAPVTPPQSTPSPVVSPD